MSLRPRYSLLTLLFLTALIAGGVKLWYGPHQMVEQRADDWQVEYTYTRDWRGEQTISGPWISRMNDDQGKPLHILLLYTRNGTLIQYATRSTISFQYAITRHTHLDASEAPRDNPLTPVEQQLFRQAIDAEREQMLKHFPADQMIEGYRQAL